MQTIVVKIKSVYGNERIYPVNFIQELEGLTGQKTLSRKHVELLKTLGFTIEVQNDTL
jgi:hypothetical protein